MTALAHPSLQSVLLGIFATLTSASVVNAGYARTPHARSNPALLQNLETRIRSWWVMIGIFFISMALGKAGALILFATVSFSALREFVSGLSTRRADHGSLSWAFYFLLPVQYLFLVFGNLTGFAVFVPVAGLGILAVRNLVAGKAEGFLDRTAEVYLAVMICVYALSHAPALTLLGDAPHVGIGLVIFFVIVVQSCDVLQFLTGKIFGKTKLAPHISPNKTIEGAVGGIALATLLGAALSWITPFNWWEAAAMATVIGTCGLCGDLFLSAIKRDLGRKDFSHTIPGHGGILDRVDSLVISAPVFFHLTRGLFFS